MRIGSNPEKDKEIPRQGYHRIIIPVYVPNLEGYFEKGMEYTKMCIESVIRTKHAESLLTVVNNGSCDAVTQYLHELYTSGDIDQLVQHTKNVGKIDAVIPIARSSSEELITISDGDVLFQDGWIQAVEDVFVHFPKAGMVAPVPNPTLYRVHSEHTLFDGFFKGMLKFRSVCNKEDLLRFAESIGSDTMYLKKSRLDYQLTMERKGLTTVVGCGHFVSTLRKEVFEFAPSNLSRLAYAGKADKDYIDIPNDKAGFWRLATVDNHAYHMGNTPQKWMKDAFQNIQGHRSETQEIPQPKIGSLDIGFKKALNRIWLSKYFRPFFFKRMGLKRGYKEY